MKIVAVCFVLLVLYGCIDNNQLLQGEWYGVSATSEEPINYFTKAVFTKDSLFLKDENVLTYQLKYILKNNYLEINGEKHPIKFTSDSTIEFLGISFVRKSKWSEDFYGRYLYGGVDLTLPQAFLLDSQEIDKPIKGEKYIDDLSVGLLNNIPVIPKNGQLLKPKDLGVFLERGHILMGTDRELNLFIDKNIPMGFIDILFKVFDSLSIYKVTFCLSNNNNSKFLPSVGIKKFLTRTVFSYPSMINVAPLRFNFGVENKHQQIIQFSGKNILLNGVEKDSLAVFNELGGSITQEPIKTLVVLLYERETTYEDFIKWYAALDNFYFSLRNTKSMDIFNVPFNKLSENQKKSISKQLPRRIATFDYDFYQKLKVEDFPYCFN